MSHNGEIIHKKSTSANCVLFRTKKKKNVVYNPSRQNWHSRLVALCFAVLLTFNRPNIEQEVSPRDIRENKLSGNTLSQIDFFWKFSSGRIGGKVWIRKKDENFKLASNGKQSASSRRGKKLLYQWAVSQVCVTERVKEKWGRTNLL